MRTRTLVAVGLVVTLLLAGVASYYASSHPDGLERVAEQVGFADRAQESAAGGSPLAGYQADGVDDDRAAGGLAGVAGALVVLALAGGLTLLLRRRGRSDAGDPADPADTGDPADTAGTGRGRV